MRAVLRGVRQMSSRLTSAPPRAGGGGVGIHFDAAAVQFVRLTRCAGPARLRLTAYGSAVVEDGVVRGALIAKPEAAARHLADLLERTGMSASELRDDTIVLALPAHGLKTEVVDYPADVPPRALRAWCERRAALLVPGDADAGLRCRVGVTWADPANHRLRLYACEAELVDARVAVLEMCGLQPQAVDAAHEAARRAFRWAWPSAAHADASAGSGANTETEANAGVEREPPPLALLQVDAHEFDLSVFDGSDCVADARERFDGIGGHPDALAGIVREVAGKLAVRPRAMYLAAQGASPGTLVAICDALEAACGIPVRPFDPLRRFSISHRRQPFAQRGAFAVACGLALRAMSVQGVSCE